ncbi:MAG TPA: putative metal-dependent hydrolase [Vicinamibacterales bacterium]|nr:putative metal-dependent hydrolase [Vicinamibacterales bacterium]
MTDLRYPTGKPAFDEHPTPDTRTALIRSIAAVPADLRTAVQGLDDAQLDTPYRPGGWSVRQVVHHVPDSHLNAYVRFKLALTEDNPTIRTYDEAAWANVADTQVTPVEVSLTLLEAVHRRWVILLGAMKDADFTRPLQHPVNGPMTLDRLLQIYAWHGPHHVAHITALGRREAWS